MNKKWLIINAVIIAVMLLAISFFVEDVMPFIYGAAAMNVLNFVAFASSSKKKTEK